MESSEKTFQILDALEREEISTQRQLAEHAGVSLGQVNFILKSLLEKGLVKIGNFRSNPSKIGYIYLLTPKGIRAKSRFALKFVVRKLEEHKALQDRLEKRLKVLEKGDRKRIILVGPHSIGEFTGSIIRERKIDLVLTGQVPDRAGLRDLDPGSFDMALLFEDTSEGLKKVAEETGVPSEKLSLFW